MKSWGWCLAGLALWSQPACAEGPLDQVSAEADVVIRVQAFESTVEKVATFAEAVQPGTGGLVSENSTAFGLLLSNPTMAGVDRTKDFYLVLSTRQEAEPKALFIVPATDAAALQKALPASFKSEARDGWVFYADESHGVPAAVTASESLGAMLDATDAGKVFSQSEIGLHLNMAHIQSVYADKIDEARGNFERAMEQARNAPGPNAEGVADVLKMELDLFQKVFEQTETWTIGVSVGEAGMDVVHLVSLDKEGDVAEFLGKQPQAEFPGLSRLVADAPVYFGMSADFKEARPLVMDMMRALYKDEAFTKSMDEIYDAMGALEISSWCGSFDLVTGSNGLISGSAFVETPKATEFLAASRKSAEAMKSVELNGVRQEMTYETEAETIGERKIDRITTKSVIDPNQPGAQVQSMVTKIMFGEDGLQQRIVALKEGLLQVGGGGQEGMEAALTAFDANSNDLSATREGLITKGHGLLILDLPGLINHGMLAATQIPDVPVPFTKETVEELAIERSYSATMISSESGTVRVHCRIPVAQFQGLVQLGMFVQSLR